MTQLAFGPESASVRLYTVQKAAALLKLTESRVIAMLENGELEGVPLVPWMPWLVDASSVHQYTGDGYEDPRLVSVSA